MRVDTAEVLEHRKSCAATNAVIVSGANTEKGEGRKLPGARTRPPAAPYPVEVCKAPMATTMSGENGRHIFRVLCVEELLRTGAPLLPRRIRCGSWGRTSLAQELLSWQQWARRTRLLPRHAAAGSFQSTLGHATNPHPWTTSHCITLHHIIT
jgi:hypothetical protein